MLQGLFSQILDDKGGRYKKEIFQPEEAYHTINAKIRKANAVKRLLVYKIAAAIIIGFLIAVGVTILAEKIILLIYGEGFIPSIITLRILIWVAALMFITYLFGNVLGSIDKQAVIAKVSGINAVVNIVLNLILIPRYGYIGAAIATLATEAIGFALYFLFIAKHLQKVPLPRYLWRPVISGVLMGMFLHFFKNTNLFVLVTLATVLYFIILHLLKTFPKEDLDLFKKIIRGNAEM